MNTFTKRCFRRLLTYKYCQYLHNGRSSIKKTIEEQTTLQEEDGPMNTILISGEVEVGLRLKSVAEPSACNIEK